MRVLDRLHEAADSTGTTGRVLRRAEAVIPSATPGGRWFPVPAARAVPQQRRSVTVVIPCYNYGRFLPQSVGSALAQEGVDVQVVVVDDVSTDDSLQVARGLAAADARVVVVEKSSNGGPGRAFNAGLDHVTGEFVARLDADDLLTPGSLARSVALLEEHPEVGLVYGHPRHFTGEVPSDLSDHLEGWTVWAGREWVAERCRQGTNCITTPEAVVRTSVLERVGPMHNDTLRHAQDMELWLRIAAVSDVGRVVGPDQALHREHQASFSASEPQMVVTDLVERREVFTLLFAGRGRELRDAEGLRRRAHRTLTAEALTQMSLAYDHGDLHHRPVAALHEYVASSPVDPRLLPAWWGLRLRQAVGARWSRRLFLGSRLHRRFGYELRYLRWVRTGL